MTTASLCPLHGFVQAQGQCWRCVMEEGTPTLNDALCVVLATKNRPGSLRHIGTSDHWLTLCQIESGTWTRSGPESATCKRCRAALQRMTSERTKSAVALEANP